MMENPLSLLAASLLPVIALDLLLRRFAAGWLAPRWRVAAGALFLAALLIPFAGFSGAQNIRGLTGDLSVGSLTMMAFVLLRAYWPRGMRRFDHEVVILAAGLLLVAAFFYPMSLGLTMTDPYAHGYYPTVLSALLFTLFCWSILARWYLAAAMLALPFAGFAAHLLESVNLWDYLFDPVLVIAAAAFLARRYRELFSMPWRSLFPRRFTTAALILVAVFLGFSVMLSQANPDAFASAFTVEDGFVESITSLTLLGTFFFCVHRFFKAHHLFGYRGKFILLLVAAVSLFGAGEEISWGQRIFAIETPEFLMERNAQQETNLHNLTFEWKGEEVKINKLVFGRGLAVAMVLYLFVLTPLYRRRPWVRRTVDSWAIPVPANHHIVAYVCVVAVVELLVDSSKRGEMTEFAGAIVFMLNVVFAANRHIYDPARRGGMQAEPRLQEGGTQARSGSS